MSRYWRFIFWITRTKPPFDSAGRAEASITMALYFATIAAVSSIIALVARILEG